MTFLATCVFILLYFIRPFEILSDLQGVPILFVTGVLAGTFLVFDVLRGKVQLFNNGTDQMMVGLYVAIGLSHVSHLYFGGAFLAMRDFFPVFIGYFLVAHSINTERKLKFFFGVLIFCAAFLAWEGVQEARNGVSFFGVQPLIQGAGVNEEGLYMTVTRIKWVGPFSDPNDLAMVFVFVIPILLDYLLNRKIFIPFALIVLICYGLYLTNSRGGILSLLATFFAYFVLRYRSRRGLVVFLILAILLLQFGPSRMGTMSASEESAYGRLEAWYHGFQLFKSAPFMGVGRGMFTDNYPFTAHNSFVLVFSELGFLGIFFFVGVFYFPLLSAVQTHFQKKSSLDIAPSLAGSYNAVLSGLVGTMVSMFFLSRSYVLLPYILVALPMSILALSQGENAHIYKNNYRHYRRIFFITLAGIIMINIIVKILL
jgi:putative inorganic carbon (hco3(-)) transporter